MKIFQNLFDKIRRRHKIGECWICNKAIYQGELYGYEKEVNSLSIVGYYLQHFCRRCIERQIGSVGESKIGEVYIITKLNGERARITITD